MKEAESLHLLPEPPITNSMGGANAQLFCVKFLKPKSFSKGWDMVSLHKRVVYLKENNTTPKKKKKNEKKERRGGRRTKKSVVLVVKSITEKPGRRMITRHRIKKGRYFYLSYLIWEI